jgi:hypothetical protein
VFNPVSIEDSYLLAFLEKTPRKVRFFAPMASIFS